MSDNDRDADSFENRAEFAEKVADFAATEGKSRLARVYYEKAAQRQAIADKLRGN